MDATAAVSEFSAATRSFSSVTRSLGPDWIAPAVQSIPWAGRQYAATRALASIGLDGSVAGLELAEALRESPAASTAASPTGRLGALLSTGRKHIDTALASLSDASSRADALSADGLAPPLASAVRSVQAALRAATPFLGRSHALLQLESYLLSGNHRLLVVSQDGAELRPTGGFAGSFGIVNVGPTGVQLEKYQDVYVLPDPPGRVPQPTGMLVGRNDFKFRDANWWIDFPTSARAMLGFWRTYNQPPVDGIIAVDTVAMRDLLAALGPVRVPSYNETFTAKNLLQRLLYLVEVKPMSQSDNKAVLTALAAELEKRVLGAKPDELAKAALALGKAADAKHVQMYFTNPDAQAAAEQLGWSGRVLPPAGTTDVVAISNAMNQPGKVNIALKKTIDYRVLLQPDRSADTTLVLGYANTGAYPLPWSSVFRDWLRVYRAPGTVFPGTTTSGGKTVTMVEFGFPAEARTFALSHGQIRSETLTARVPEAMHTASTPAATSGDAHYQLYLVRQADLEDIPTTITVTAPSGWRVISANAWLTASGAPLPVTSEQERVRMAFPLSGDTALDVRLATF